MKNYFVLILVVFAAVDCFSQSRKLITDEEIIRERAFAELEYSIQNPEGELFKLAQKNQISGKYTFDISIRNKGEVVTVFIVGSSESDIKKQNLIKDKVKSHRFNFKMPKGRIYKFQFTFNL